jgi:energy-coupling factor transport system ATP-binding protein
VKPPPEGTELPAEPHKVTGAPRAAAATLEDVTFTYHGAERAALRGVNLRLDPGEMIGIMGASGAGKSTLAKCLNRIVPAFEDGDFRGVVRIGGRVLDGVRVCDVASTVGMVFQDFESQLFSTNVAHEVAFAMEQIAMPHEEIAARIMPALEAVGLSGFEDRDPTSLSGGEKQRLAIAAVLALRPRVIVLDEPTTDLDPEGKVEVFALIRQLREQGLSLIVIEHEAEELRDCDRIMLVRDGAIIAEGPPADVMTRLELLEECGVHPPDLNRVLGMLGIRVHAASIAEAESMIRKAFPRIDRSREIPPRESQAYEMRMSSAASTSDGVPAAARDPIHAPSPAPPLVEVQNLSFAYPFGPRVLNSVNLRIEAGEFFAIIGQNGYVFQNPDHQIFAATVEDEVAFGPRNFGLDHAEVERRCAEVLEAVNLADARDRDPFLLSKGERQRLAVASVLALRPRLLILDEPTTGLDYREQRRMMALVSELNRSGIAIVIITHTPWLVAEYARRVVLMRKGTVLFDGGVREFFAQDELLRASSFRPPEVTALARRFGTVALRPEEFVEWLRERA